MPSLGYRGPALDDQVPDRDPSQAAAEDAAAPPDPTLAEKAHAAQVAALRRELAGYQTRGLTERADQAAAVLDSLGEEPAERPTPRRARRASR